VDAATLANYALEDGTNFQAVVAMLNAGLSAVNNEMASDPIWSGLISFQSDPDVSYRVGTSNGFERHNEWTRPDSKRADVGGHMLPLKSWDRMLGWTWDYLRKARMPQVEADIADALKDARDLWRVQLLTRLLDRDDETVGTSGYSTGFATTAGSTNVDFVPPSFGGTAFASTHEHYVGITGGAYTNEVFEDIYDELREHGHEAPFYVLVGPDHRDEIAGLTDSYPVSDGQVIYGAAANLARAEGGAFAYNNHCYVFEVRGIPQYYGFGYKSYGALSQRNPLRVRTAKNAARPQAVAMPDPRSGAGAVYPLQNIMLFVEFGVGVGDRTNGTPRYVNSATWADGTPT